ncbi:MAG: hypothetical protein WBA59_08525 [Moheibacter sp.]
MATELNDSQLEVLKLLNFLKNEKDVAEIKSLLRAYLADKVVRSADQAFDEKAYTIEIFNRWKQEHFRRNTQ